MPFFKKKLLLFFTVFFLFQLSSFEAESQTTPDFTLWGTTSSGGSGNGNIFNINPDGSGLNYPKIFETGIDVNANGGLIYHNGYLYGTTSSGGTFGFGTIIKLKPDGTDYQSIFSFNLENGASPLGNLILGLDGKLYGITGAGGTNSAGIIFKIDTDGSHFVSLYDFGLNTNNSSHPRDLIQASDGLLYGITYGGGNYGLGAVFKINTDGSYFTDLLHFKKTETGTNSGNVIEGTDGYLYTMTGLGALNERGAIIKLTKDGDDYTILKNMDYSGLFVDVGLRYLYEASNGKLYGTNTVRGTLDRGSVFCIQKDGTNYEELANFDGSNGSELVGSLVQDLDGVLDGLSIKGGLNDLGVIYKLNEDGTEFNTVYNFEKSTSGHIINSFRSTKLLAINGALFGATTSGAASNNGMLFKIAEDQTFIKIKDYPQDLTDPQSNLLLSSDGLLYGTTVRGGFYGFGGIYKIHQDGSNYQELYQFSKLDGAHPRGLVEDSEGYLYGMTSDGGINDLGVIYKFKKDGSSFQKLFDFDGTNGSTPFGSLTLANNGLLYGTTSDGGNGLNPYCGGIFKIEKDGTNFEVLINFDYSNGCIPMGTLIQATDGNLYGISSASAINPGGEIFKLDLQGNNFQQVIGFDDNTIGSGTNAGLRFFQAPNERLYGMTTYGALNGTGSIFSVNLDGSDMKKLHDFERKSAISGGMVLGPDGFIYCGRSRGSVFKIKLDGTQFSKLFDFMGSTGTFSAPTILLKPKSQTITFNQLITKTYKDSEFILSATTNSNLPITYISSNTTVATVNGNIVTIVGAGTTTITASQAGNNHFLPAPSVEQQLVVNKASQTITFSSLAEKKFKDETFDLTATSDSGLEITYTSGNTDVATINGNTVTIVGAGTITITASQAGDNNYLAASDVEQQLVVSKASQMITFSSLSDKTIGTSSFALSATSSSGLIVNFMTSSDKITIAENQVTLIKAGRVSIEARQTGDTNYLEAAAVTQSFCINPVKPNITITSEDQSTLSSSTTAGNQWYLNGVSIEGAVNTTFTASQAGVYTVQTQVDDCKSEISSGTSLIVTGDIYASSKEIKVYPNPATQKLTISLPDDRSAKEITIYSIDGKIVEQVSTFETELILSIGTYLNGPYFLRIISGERQFNNRFIKK